MNKVVRCIFIISIFISSMTFASEEKDLQMLFDKANASYKAKNYQDALNKYLQIEKQDKFSTDLYLNIGNTYFKMGDYANSVLYYERGLRIKPNDESLTTNLKVVKSRLKGDVFELKDFFLVRMWHGVSNMFMPSTWAIVCIVIMLLACVVFVFYYFTVDYKIISFYSLLFTVLLLIISIFAGLSRQSALLSKNAAIVFEENIAGKDSPDLKSTDRMKLFKGQKVMIVDKEDDWIKIRQQDSKEAWIEKKDLVVI